MPVKLTRCLILLLHLPDNLLNVFALQCANVRPQVGQGCADGIKSNRGFIFIVVYRVLSSIMRKFVHKQESNSAVSQ